MWGALAIRFPSGSNRAHEKSSRSLMLTECAVRRSETPICSAIDMNRLLNSSSRTGSTVVSPAVAATVAATRSSTRWPRSLTVARQDDSTTVVAVSSAMTAGPSTTDPAARSDLATRSTSRRAPSTTISTRSSTRTLPWSGPSSGFLGATTSSSSTPDSPTTSTCTASTTTAASGSRNANWRR